MTINNILLLFSLIRPINSFMIGLAVIVGIAIGFPEMVLTSVSLFGFITGFAISGYSMIINDVYDIEIDKINQPERPLPQGFVSIKLAISFSLILLFLGLASSLFISFYNLAIAGLFSLLSWSYNVWGKKNGFIGNFMVASSMAIPFIFGGIITGNLSILIWSISLLAFLSGMGREIIKTISDIKGDKSKGIESVSITLGPKNAARIASLFLFIAILVSLIPIYFNLINFIYLPLLLITDILFVYSIFKISTDFSQIQAIKIKTIILYSMLLGLITFLLNSMVLF